MNRKNQENLPENSSKEAKKKRLKDKLAKLMESAPSAVKLVGKAAKKHFNKTSSLDLINTAFKQGFADEWNKLANLPDYADLDLATKNEAIGESTGSITRPGTNTLREIMKSLILRKKHK